jgi:hypothetical protein
VGGLATAGGQSEIVAKAFLELWRSGGLEPRRPSPAKQLRRRSLRPRRNALEEFRA